VQMGLMIPIITPKEEHREALAEQITSVA
jgi:hypothetical protein